LRARLLKIAARITETATRVRIAFAAACPEADVQGMGVRTGSKARSFLQADIISHDLWIAQQECDCQPFKFVDELRGAAAAGIQHPRIPHKARTELALRKDGAALRAGTIPRRGISWTITAMTRARLIEAVAQDLHSVLMLATDAVFSTRPLSLDIGERLGQWEEKVWPDLFIAQPGVYWSPSDVGESVKSRGAPRSMIGPAVPRFHEVFGEFLDLLRCPGAPEHVLKERLVPSVPVMVRVFNGCRLALARGKPWLAGKWEDVARNVSFEWRTKRDAMRIEISGAGYLSTFPIAHSIFAESEGYKPADFDRLIEISGESGSTLEIDENMLLEAMPDFIPFLPGSEKGALCQPVIL